ncbi:relaxase/mobilization nuclease domain-containing protein [Streptomyces sp. SA3_actF]|uniref:relaxase/mobilization nuclease domain-containing protein n=1 Tax=Streptomyces sp. SA3_actF TaxID=682181 RepID=UPI0001FFF919|nr:relaxase/mobilization nuclease domain-containing protein [Streptomyces sp. SA3_actF]
MNPNITRGSRIYGLLAYLYGPGRHNEHTDPHLVGSWDGFAPDPGRDPNVTLKHLANTLALRPSQLGDALHKRHVWHCSVRAAPEDRELTDREWDMIARRVLHAVGVSREGEDDGCRWVAVRHARDHIHIAATLVRGDLRKVYPRYDYPKAQAACRELEAELGLRRLNPGDRTAAKRASTGERRKAERLNLPELPSDTLRTAVRQALAAASTEEEFFARLAAARILVRHKKGPSGDVLGYSVALPDDDTPIWYAGSTLAPDLSLPKIRRALPNTMEPLSVQAARASRPEAVRRRATSRLDRAQHALARGGDDGADDLAGTGAVLDALAATANEPTRSEILQAARAFERATRSHVRAENADRRALRAAAREIIRAGTPARTTEPPPQPSSPPSSSPSPPLSAGTRPADTRSRPPQPARQPNTSALPTGWPPPPPWPPSETARPTSPPPNAPASTPPSPPHYRDPETGSAPRGRWMPSPPRSQRRRRPATTPRPCCGTRPARVNCVPP